MVDSGLPPKKWPFFCPKMAFKCHFWAENSGFLGSGGQFDAPPPYFAGA